MVAQNLSPTPSIAYWFFRSMKRPTTVMRGLGRIMAHSPSQPLFQGETFEDAPIQLNLMDSEWILKDSVLTAECEELAGLFPYKEYDGIDYVLEAKSTVLSTPDIARHLSTFVDVFYSFSHEGREKELLFDIRMPHQRRYCRMGNTLYPFLL